MSKKNDAMTIREIAEMQGCSVATAATRMDSFKPCGVRRTRGREAREYRRVDAEEAFAERPVSSRNTRRRGSSGSAIARAASDLSKAITVAVRERDALRASLTEKEAEVERLIVAHDAFKQATQPPQLARNGSAQHVNA